MNKNFVLIGIILMLVIAIFAGGYFLISTKAVKIDINELLIPPEKTISTDSTFENKQIELVQTNQEHEVIIYVRAVSNFDYNVGNRLFVSKKNNIKDLVSPEKIIKKCNGKIIEDIEWEKENTVVFSCPLTTNQNTYHATIEGENFLKIINVAGVSISKEVALEIIKVAYLDFEENVFGQRKIPFSQKTYQENLVNQNEIDFLPK